MRSHFLTYKDSRIHYLTWGHGSRLLYCFHGYGESAASFHLLAEKLAESFTLVAIDLPFHGKTEWRQDLTFTPGELLEIMESIRTGQRPGASALHLAGYSMGGRVALAVFQLIPERVKKMVLMAPDGLRMNGFYWLATQTVAGNRLFRWLMRHPGVFLRSQGLARRLGLVNQSISKFSLTYLRDKKIREDLYCRWTTMRRFRPSPARLRKQLQGKPATLDLVYGRYDRIIRYETGMHFRKGIESACAITILEAGHQLLQPKLLHKLVPLFHDHTTQ